MTLEEVMYLIEDKEEELVELYVNLSKIGVELKEKIDVYINTLTGEIVNSHINEVNDVNCFYLFSVDYEIKIDDEKEYLYRLESNARIVTLGSVNNIRRKLHLEIIPVFHKYRDDYNYLLELSKEFTNKNNKYNFDRDIRNTFSSYNLGLTTLIMLFLKAYSINNNLIKYFSDTTLDFEKDKMYFLFGERSFFNRTYNTFIVCTYDILMKDETEKIIYKIQKFQSELFEKISKNITNKNIIENFEGINYKIVFFKDIYGMNFDSPYIFEVSKNFIHF